MLKLSIGHRSDIGLVRKVNQDNLLVAGSKEFDGRIDTLIAIADGMGGHAGGEIASAIALKSLNLVLREWLFDSPGPVDNQVLSDAIREAMAAANEDVLRHAAENHDLRGMGTTCVAAVIHGSTAVIGNLGDSRLYHLQAGKLRQVTADHSLVQEYVRAGEMTAIEAKGSRFRNVVTRGIGISKAVDPDVTVLPLQEGDGLLLCSDGLTNMVKDRTIEQIIASERDPQIAADRLVAEANDKGGIDNITVIIAHVGKFVPVEIAPERTNGHFQPERYDEDEGIDFASERESRRRRKPATAGSFTVFLLLVLVVALGAALVYVGQETYQVTSEWPLFKHISTKPKQTLPPPIDFGKLVYSDPEIYLKKPVRGAPVTCDAAGNVYVTSETGKILRVTTGEKFTMNALAPTEQPRQSPTYWATDEKGYLYVSTRNDGCIYKYSPEGTRVGEIGKGRLKAPEGIAVDGVGNLYVVDEARLHIIRAKAPEPPPAPPASGGSNASG
jgi:protein phosphatase